MRFCEAIKKLRQYILLSQEAFGKEIGVTFATVNRWESGKTLPNYRALKQIEELCKKHNIDFEEIRSTIMNKVGGEE
ncbi:MAG: helix-turn-helix transcriptional regulator [Clostridia bacterium]|nr:helix-turn-helix transcriptional regulator [Clostridia bacterium]